MKFFLPALETNPEEAEETYQDIVRFTEKQQYTVKPRRIYQIEYSCDGRRGLIATVGQREHVDGNFPIIAILEATLGTEAMYLICTWLRGMKYGPPIMVAAYNVHRVVDFDAG